MNSRLIAAVGCLAFFLASSAVFGQCGCSVPTTTYAPVVSSYTAEYAPVTAYYAPTYTTYYTPTTAYYAPASYAVPTTTYYAPQAYVSYYAPQVSYYAPTTAYYAAAMPYAAYYAPVARPYAVAGTSIYGTPKVFVRGQPVRNYFRATTP